MEIDCTFVYHFSQDYFILGASPLSINGCEILALCSALTTFVKGGICDWNLCFEGLIRKAPERPLHLVGFWDKQGVLLAYLNLGSSWIKARITAVCFVSCWNVLLILRHPYLKVKDQTFWTTLKYLQLLAVWVFYIPTRTATQDLHFKGISERPVAFTYKYDSMVKEQSLPMLILRFDAAIARAGLELTTFRIHCNWFITELPRPILLIDKHRHI
jgi:hypothetical protein